MNAVSVSDQKATHNVVEILVGHIHDSYSDRLTRLDKLDRVQRTVEQLDLQHFRTAIAVTINVTEWLVLENLVRGRRLFGGFVARFVRLLPRHDDLLVTIEHVGR